MSHPSPTVTENGRVFHLADFACSAAMLGISPELLDSGIARGQLPFTVVRIGARGQRFLKTSAIVAWLEGRHASASV